VRILLLVVLLSGCSIVPREGTTPEVRLHIAEQYCDKVKLKEKHSGIVFECINYWRNKG
jgi:hypothetical protein